MQRRSFLVTAGILAVAPLLDACGKKPRLAALPTGSVVLAFGDSVTFGTGAASGEDWPTLLAARTGWQVVNAGVPGDTAEVAGARLGVLLAEHRPQLVFLELGGNDLLRGRSGEAIKADLRRLIREIRASGAQVVLVAVPAMSLQALVGHPADAPIYAALAEEESIPLVADVFAKVLGQAEWRSDAIHPNAEGYRQMAAGIQARLQQLGLVGR